MYANVYVYTYTIYMYNVYVYTGMYRYTPP